MSFVVYLAASAFAAVSVLLFRRPRKALRDPLTASTCVAITLGSLVFICSAPLTLGAVNRLTGIANFGAPLTYSMLSAYSCSLLILLFTWRGGPPGTVRRMALRCITAYGTAIVAIIALFILADADTERLTDLDTYYANAPYMREMILLYLLGHSTATLAICTVCVKWAREVDGLLRTGLRVILAGGVLDGVGFQLMKYTAVVAAWRGHDLSVLSTTIAPPMASLAGLICSVGFVLPRLLPPAVAHWRSLGDYRRLGRLWSEVGFVAIAPKPPTSWWHLPQDRLHWREVSIHDALLALAPHFDDRVRTRALAAALGQGSSPHEARVASEAAMLADATRRAAAREEPLETPSTYRFYATEVSGAEGLVELAQALEHSPSSPASATVR
ncbi:MAB_1171c family putative transporter [Streptomyces sp. ADMS]|uniref:MAB_1171c family putative transporter n=1 Tax=Streptomyces sp. ADMS TaxID=3071415 RepID=UPI0029700503|nr:MAB_1171c family putative transporter [Streptomyces sp. ADMS]MDW4910067.1 MAB_1171c family putative transporter [Streptomyces sp. ADMS]